MIRIFKEIIMWKKKGLEAMWIFTKRLTTQVGIKNIKFTLMKEVIRQSLVQSMSNLKKKNRLQEDIITKVEEVPIINLMVMQYRTMKMKKRMKVSMMMKTKWLITVRMTKMMKKVICLTGTALKVLVAINTLSIQLEYQALSNSKITVIFKMRLKGMQVLSRPSHSKGREK